MKTRPWFDAQGIRKSFFAREVLKGVDVAVSEGEVLGLVGENGAGKSTLMNILGGVLFPDVGHMEIDGQEYVPQSPRDAVRRGISFIHQELNLFHNLSIAENLAVADLPRRGRGWLGIDRRKLRAEAVDALQAVGLHLSPDLRLDQLSAGEKQLVEIAKAIRRRSRLIIYDEPTTSLAEPEIRRLFAIMADLKARGFAQIFISHQLTHVLEQCDRVQVLRDGEPTGMGPAADYSEQELVRLMVGRSMDQVFPGRKERKTGEVTLQVSGLTEPGLLENISFEARSGEVLGIAGLMGAGRTELLRVLFGVDHCERGSISLHGHEVSQWPLRRRVQAGMAFLTEDRRAEGLAMDGSIFDNSAAVVLPEFARPVTGLLEQKRLGIAVQKLSRRVKITESATPNSPVHNLSGGNQQKVVLAKWLLNNPSVMLLDEPTRGVDVGAKFEIYGLINELVEQGNTILMVSSELEELIGMCDRILVMHGGGIRGQFNRDEFEFEQILRTAFGQDTTGS